MLEVWLESLAMHTSVGHQTPSDLKFDIEHFKGSPSRESSLSSTPEGPCTPPATKKIDYFGNTEAPTATVGDTTDAAPKIKTSNCAEPHQDSNNSNSINKFIVNNVASNNNVMGDKIDMSQISQSPAIADHSPFSNVIREIPKSPHLSKDFSPNGDRIRNSIRARRQERMLKQRSLLEANSNATSPGPSSLGDQSEINSSFEREDSPAPREISNDHLIDDAPLVRPNTFTPLKRKRSRPYGEKGFIINIDDGLLSLNNVKNLDNCSDFDSSCDTSLNYVDVNYPSFDSHSSAMKPTCKPPTTTTIIETTPTIEMPATAFSSSFDLSNNGGNDDVGANIAHKNTLDEIKRQLNLCKTKLEALELADNNKLEPPILAKRDCRDAQRKEMSLGKMRPTSPQNGTTFNNSLDYLFSPTKPKSPIKAYSMFSRLNPLSPLFNTKQRGKVVINETYPPANRHSSSAPPRKSDHHSLSPNTSPDIAEKPLKSTKLFRINDTPIFERRKIQSLLPSKLFKRSDSDDNINKTYPTASFSSHAYNISPKSSSRSNNSFRIIANDSENMKARSNNSNKTSSNQPEYSDKTSPIRKYFTMNQSKILPKTNEPNGERSKSDWHKVENDHARIRKNSKVLLTNSNAIKYSYKKFTPSTVQVHNSNAHRKHDIYDNHQSKHIFVSCMDPSCSSSATHPITLQNNKSVKFSSLFGYDDEMKKMANESALYRMKGADKAVTPNGKKPTLHTKVFRN